MTKTDKHTTQILIGNDGSITKKVLDVNNVRLWVVVRWMALLIRLE
jgi:hypothetical protein